MTVAIRHTGLVVSNLERALEFWCGIFNFEVVVRMDEEGSSLDAIMGLRGVKVVTVKLNAPSGGMLELLNFQSHPDKKKWLGEPFSTGLTHIALTVSDVESTLNEMKNFGCDVKNNPHLSPDGKVKVVYAQGPEGVLLELVEIIS